MPQPEFSTKCYNCSLYESCLPKLPHEQGKVHTYIKNRITEVIGEETT